ncbi:MAG: hypothetical protein U5O39_11870 [Gammaproteobacteria bacterium]|nr:hypothetical protein [Gammaproteobacteria bacterium]
MTPTQAAEQILRGIRKKACCALLVGRDARLTALVERLLPVGYLKLFDRAWWDDQDSVSCPEGPKST